MTLRKPLLIEGHPGVGKTEVARVLARALDTTLIRLQCYEGLDASTALYEWNYPKQLLHIRLDEGSERPWRLSMSYIIDVFAIRHGRVDDGVLQFT